MTAAETCGCGATFTVTSAEASALIALNAWRRNHPCKVRASSPAETLAPGYGVKSVLDEINSNSATSPEEPDEGVRYRIQLSNGEFWEGQDMPVEPDPASELRGHGPGCECEGCQPNMVESSERSPASEPSEAELLARRLGAYDRALAEAEPNQESQP